MCGGYRSFISGPSTLLTMRFTLDARLVFSRDMSDSEEPIGKAIDQANEELLLRGVPGNMEERKAGGAHVGAWKIKGNEVHLHITSGAYVRAHEAVLRLRKHLAQELGKELRAGIRQVFLDEYTVVFDLPSEPTRPLTIPFAHSVEVDGKTCTLVLKDVSDEMVGKNAIDRMIKRLGAKAGAQAYEGKGEFWELMESHGDGKGFWDKDPTDEMVERGWLKQGPTKGKWFFRPQLAKVMRVMKDIAVKEFLDPLGFQEIVESHMVPFMTRITLA
ncbi:MAG: hypothetical protein KAT70_07325, partial [Thermoplasmata archaeon]|nr:hypothetical protein [Thermoplasmata archaeon]